MSWRTHETSSSLTLHEQEAAGSVPVASLPSPRDIRRRAVLGIPIAMTSYGEAMDVMDGMIARREPGYLCAVAVHAVMVSQHDPEMRAAVTRATLTVPDGMPLVWAANALGEQLPNRVYGPELMDRYCARCAEKGHRVWLYGGRDQGSLMQLALNLRRRHRGIEIVGGYSPPFRSLSHDEEDAIAAQINEARPDVVWVGIGVPKQEKWMARMRDRLEAPVLCGGGAAFDFHAGRTSEITAAGARTWSRLLRESTTSTAALTSGIRSAPTGR